MIIWDYARTTQQHQTLPGIGQYIVWTAKPNTGGAPPGPGAAPLDQKPFLVNVGRLMR